MSLTYVSSMGLRVFVGICAALIVSAVSAKYLVLAYYKKETGKQKKHRPKETLKELNRPNVFIENPDKVGKIIDELIKGGAKRLQVVTDFDQTLTKVHHNGVPCHSSYGILDTSPLIPRECQLRARMLKDKYYPIEFDPSLTSEQKIPHMVEWYKQSHQVLVSSGIKRSDFARMVEASRVMMRDGCKELFHTLNGQDIPLLIFSAGLGDLLEETLRYYDLRLPNMEVISNYMEFGLDGTVVGFRGPLIHMFNKNQNSLLHKDYFQRVAAGRRNVILMGDSLGDLHMADGMPQRPAAMLRIGFLNNNIPENLPQYMAQFDIVLADDQTMDIPNAILDPILNPPPPINSECSTTSD